MFWDPTGLLARLYIYVSQTLRSGCVALTHVNPDLALLAHRRYPWEDLPVCAGLHCRVSALVLLHRYSCTAGTTRGPG